MLVTNDELAARLFPEGRRHALLLLHLQNEVVHPDGFVGARGLAVRVSGSGLVARVQEAQAAADAANVPVFDIVFAAYGATSRSTARALREGARTAFAAGSWGAKVFDPLARDRDAVIEHDTMSAFAGTDLAQLLEAAGVTAVVLAGVGTHLVVTATAFAAADLGLEVTVLADCSQAPSELVHEAALAQLGSVGTVTAVRL